MSASILVVDDESDVGERFRQRTRHETRQGTSDILTDVRELYGFAVQEFVSKSVQSIITRDC